MDHTGRILVDGRNRENACDLAGVEPTYIRLPEDTDLRAYIISKNINRRHLSMGQQALALALIYPEPEVGGRGKVSPAKTKAKRAGFSIDRVKDARQIIKHGDLVTSVKSGAMTFDMALTEAKQRALVEHNAAQYLGRLIDVAPDLAALVREEQLTLREAWAAYQKRLAELKQRRWAFTTNLIQAVEITDRDPESAAELLELFDAAVEEQKNASAKITTERLLRASQYLAALAAAWEHRSARLDKAE